MTEIIAKFKCEGECGNNLGVKHEKGARKCKDCELYFICWPCNKNHKYPKGKFGLCHPCSEKPKTCEQPGCENIVTFGSCKDCWRKRDVIVLVD